MELNLQLGSVGQFTAFAQRQADLLFKQQRFGEAATELRAAAEHVEGEQRAVLQLLLAYGLLRGGELLEFRELWSALDHASLLRCEHAGLRRLHDALERLWRENRAAVQVIERLEARAAAESFAQPATLTALIELLEPLDSLKTCELLLRLLALQPDDARHRELFRAVVLRVPDAATRTRLRARLSQLIH